METPSKNLSWCPLLVTSRLTLMNKENLPLGTNELVKVQDLRKIRGTASKSINETPKDVNM